MLFVYWKFLILSAFFFQKIICSRNDFAVDVEESNALNDGNDPAFTDDEISYALSELSVDDLNILNKLMDMLSEGGDLDSENGLSKDEKARFKRESANIPYKEDDIARENSDTPSKEDQDDIMSKVDEEYIHQLDESFPNLIDQLNRVDKDKPHIRVKRY